MQSLDVLLQKGQNLSRDFLYCQLQQCIKRKDLVVGRHVHFSIVSKGLDTVTVLVNHVLRFYIACDSLLDAMQVFESHKPNIYSYNAIMSLHAKLADGNKTLELFAKLQDDGLMPDICTFLSILNACGKLSAACKGRLVHHQITETGLDTHVSMSNTVIDMYGKCACLSDSHKVFDRLSTRNVVSWAALISGYSQNEYVEYVLELFEKMRSYDLKPNDVIFTCVLRAIGSFGLLHAGRLVHEEIIVVGLERVDVVVTSVIDMYLKANSLEDARVVFEGIESINIVSWNAMIMGYANHGECSLALALFQALQLKHIKPDNVTYLGALKACTYKEDIHKGKVLHYFIVESGQILDAALSNSLMYMYTRCGSIHDAQNIFSHLPNPEVSSWGTIIDGYAEHGYGVQALQAFENMQVRGIKPNAITFNCSLKACIEDGLTSDGRILHDQVVRVSMESNILIGSTIVHMYVKHQSLEEARNSFDRLQDRDVVAWGAMISGYVQLGFTDLALQLFIKMLITGLDANAGIFVPVLQACVTMNTIETGSLLHGYILECGFETDRSVGTVLVHLYASFGYMEEAHLIFDAHLNKDVVTWGAIIAGHLQYGHHDSALELFVKLKMHNVKPNRVIFLCTLKACTYIGTLGDGRLVHKEVIETGLETDITLANALIDMYGKCGDKDDACAVLCKLPKRDVVSWTALVGGCGSPNDIQSSLKYFDAMKQEKLQPDDAVFINLLATCSREGALEKGLVCFKDMLKTFDTMPDLQHYYSIADLLMRVGLFTETEDLLLSMPNSENVIGWTSLLSGCKAYGNIELSYTCFDAIANTVSDDAPNFMLDVL